MKLYGHVVWFDSKKGYGFIRQDNTKEDLFVHYSDIKSKGFKSLNRKQIVSFYIGKNYNNKPKAIDVEILYN